MAWSRWRKWFLLILAILFLVLLVAAWLQPVSPLRNAYNQIRKGMSVVQVEEVLKRCGWSKYRNGGGPVGGGDPTYFSLGAGIERVDFMPVDTLMYRDASGETLTIHWEGPWDWDQAQGLSLTGHVVGKEYHSGRGLWEQLRRMLHW
jgi:hypothetical protein